MVWTFTSLAHLPLAVPFDSAKQYEDSHRLAAPDPARVRADAASAARGLARSADGRGRFLLEKVRAQCEGVIAADPFVPAHLHVSVEYSRRGATASDAADHRDRGARGAAGLPGVRAVHRARIRTARVAPRRTSLRCPMVRRAIAMRLQWHHREHAHARSDSCNWSARIRRGSRRKWAPLLTSRAIRMSRPSAHHCAPIRSIQRASSEQIVDDFRKYIDGMKTESVRALRLSSPEGRP